MIAEGVLMMLRAAHRRRGAPQMPPVWRGVSQRVLRVSRVYARRGELESSR